MTLHGGSRQMFTMVNISNYLIKMDENAQKPHASQVCHVSQPLGVQHQ